MTLIAHFADLHLGYRQYGLLEREEDLYETFNEAMEQVLREHVELVLIAGDVFHSCRPPVRALYCMKLSLEKLSSRGVKVYCVLGDHDFPRRVGEWPPTVLFEGKLLKHIDGKNVEIEAGDGLIVITGMDRAPPSLSEGRLEKLEQLSRQAQERPGKRILLTHVSSSDTLSGLTLNDLPENYHYYALGHEHARQVISKGLGIAAYPGSIDIMSRDEIIYWKNEGKGFYMVDLSGSEPGVQKVNLTSIRPQEICEISLKEPLEKVYTWIINQHKKPLLHLIIKDHDFDRRKLNEVIKDMIDRGCLDVKYISKGFESRFSPHIDLTRFDIEKLIKDSSSQAGLTEEESNLALQIYRIFHRDGEEALRNFILLNRDSLGGVR